MSQTAVTAVDLKLSDVDAFRLAGAENPGAGLSAQATQLPEPSDAVRSFRVALVTMPFSFIFRPSIQLGLLKAIGRRAGFPVDDLYPNLDLAVQIGFDFYEEVQASSAGRNYGEWLFSVAAFGEESSREDFLGAFPEISQIAARTGKDDAYVNDLRDRVLPEYIDACLNQVDWGAYKVVGFTSTWQQNVASLALARRIKERFPHVVIIFGGGNYDGDMGAEYVRTFPYIDYAVSGEADVVFPELLTCLAEGRDAAELLGVIARRGDTVAFHGQATPIKDLNQLPTPDYDTYFEAARRYGIDKYADSMGAQEFRYDLRAMPIEGSRGCWWGMKSHCTFCGFNRTSMVYRSKTAERLIAEVAELSTRYDRKAFWACDNILDVKHITELFGVLGEQNKGYEFFFDLKANLTRDQVRTLAKGGMRVMQPGIESLNTHVLKLMKKGITKLQNANLLKWCTYYKIQPAWNLLYGFPGETLEDYADELATVRLIPHLAPPMECLRVRLDRFSPNFWDKEMFPVKWQGPDAAYKYIYPPQMNMEAAAYYYEYEPVDDMVPDAAYQDTKDAVALWCRQWATGYKASLTYRRTESDIVIEDRRFGLDQPRTYTLFGPDADVYEACSTTPRTPAQVCAAFSSECPGFEPDEDSIADACNAFCDAGLMIGETGKYLSLALPADPEF